VPDMRELLAMHPFVEGLDDEVVALLAGCAVNVHLEPGSYVFRLGDPADRFYLLRHGRVALELHAPGTSRLVLDTVEDGDALGWSWLVPPHEWFLDARVVAPVSAIALDGRCLREKCDRDPALGYALLGRVAQVMYARLQSARLRLLDLYGGSRAG